MKREYVYMYMFHHLSFSKISSVKGKLGKAQVLNLGTMNKKYAPLTKKLIAAYFPFISYNDQYNRELY